MIEQENSQGSLTDEEIAAVAYQIYFEEACPEGRDVEHWSEAKKRLSETPQPGQPGGATDKIIGSIQTSS